MICNLMVLSKLMSVYAVSLFVYAFQMSGVACVRAGVHACVFVGVPTKHGHLTSTRSPASVLIPRTPKCMQSEAHVRTPPHYSCHHLISRRAMAAMRVKEPVTLLPTPPNPHALLALSHFTNIQFLGAHFIIHRLPSSIFMTRGGRCKLE